MPNASSNNRRRPTSPGRRGGASSGLAGASADAMKNSSPSGGGLAGRSSSSSKPQKTVNKKRPASPARKKPDPSRYANAASAADPFADTEQQQPRKSGKKAATSPRRAQKQNAKAQRKAEKKQKASRREKSDLGLIARIQRYLRSRSPKDIYLDALEWLASKPYVIILIAVIFIAIGMFFGRYYSFGCALALAGIGALMSREDLDTASYICYAAAFADFLIPYMIQ